MFLLVLLNPDKKLAPLVLIYMTLKENHLRQATDYAAKEGIEWVVLTNGIEWQAYRMIFEQPVSFEHVFTMNILEGGPDLAEMIYMLSREGITKEALHKYREQRRILNRNVVSAIVLSEPIIKAIRRELRKMSPKMRILPDDIKELLTTEILKRDIVEGEDLKGAKRKVRRAGGRKRTEGRDRSEKAPVVQTTPLANHANAQGSD